MHKNKAWTSTHSLNATARKAHNLFVAQQKKDVSRSLSQIKRQLMNGDGSSLPAANEPAGGGVRGREQRISDSGHSSAGSVASSGSSFNANNESGKLPNGRGELSL